MKILDDKKKYSASEVAQYVETMFNCDGPRKTILYQKIWRELFGKQPFKLRKDLKDKYNEAIDMMWDSLVRIESSRTYDENPRFKLAVESLRTNLKIIAPEFLE